MNFVEIGYLLGMKFVPFLFALCFHEFAHGWVAKLRGDRTAEFEGRLSMNPMVHADPFGTFMLPILAIVSSSGFFFGWAKPVPVNSRNLKNPKWDMFWVSLAGPMSNVLLAVVATVGLGLAAGLMRHDSTGAAVSQLLGTFIQINLFLAVFNLIPIHPLDGGKVVEPFLPYAWNKWLEDNQTMLNIGLMLFIFLAGAVLALPVNWVAQHLLRLAGLIAHSV